MKAKAVSSQFGLSVAIVEGSEIAREDARGVTPGALFQAGSVSKSVAALAALRLVESGVLDLDGAVNDRLRSWRVPAGETVTLRMLLGHTAGLGVDFFPGYPPASTPPSLVQVLDGVPPAHTPAVRVEREPGQGFRYSGGGYVVLQVLMTDVTGIPFPELAAELVLEPLGMGQSTFEQPLPQALHPRAARRGWRVYPEAAAAGLWTTPADLARFVAGIQRALSGVGGPVTSEMAASMTTAAVVLPPQGEWSVLRTLGIEPPDRFGLGLFLDDYRFSHLGGSAGFFCVILGSLEDGTGAALMMNSDPQPIFFEILLALADEYEWRGFRCEVS